MVRLAVVPLSLRVWSSTPGVWAWGAVMTPLDLVKLDTIMRLTRGSSAVAIGLIDGPVALQHPGLSHARVTVANERYGGTCGSTGDPTCRHGTAVAGILVARRGSRAPAICPACALVVHPIFGTFINGRAAVPEATPDELAEAIRSCVAAGARVLNLSVAIARPSMRQHAALGEALDHAARRGVIVVAAAGNQGSIGSSVITRHPVVIPVTAGDRNGRPVGGSNMGMSIGRRGLGTPGSRRSIVPPNLDAWAAYQSLAARLGHPRGGDNRAEGRKSTRAGD